MQHARLYWAVGWATLLTLHGQAQALPPTPTATRMPTFAETPVGPAPPTATSKPTKTARPTRTPIPFVTPRPITPRPSCSPTPRPTDPPHGFVDPIEACPGDCDQDRSLDIGEVLKSVATALGHGEAACASTDTDGDGTIGVNDLVATVQAALLGCSVPFRRIAHGIGGDLRFEQRGAVLLANDESTYRQIWSRLRTGEPPDLDFADCTVAFVIGSNFSSGGNQFEPLAVRKTSGRLNVTMLQTSFERGCPVTLGTEKHYSVLQLPKLPANLATSLERTRATRSCSCRYPVFLE